MQKPTAVVGRRCAAFIIDVVLSALITVIAWFALTTQVPGKCPSSGGGFTIGDHCRGFVVGQSGKQTAWYIIGIVGGLLLFVVLPGIKGWSPGKLLLGIRVVNPEGRPPGVLRAFLRYILWIVDYFPYIFLPLVGFVTAVSTQRNQRVGDMAANTFVVDKSFFGSPIQFPTQQFVAQPAFGGPPPAGVPFQPGPPPTGAPVPQTNGGQKADWYPDPQGQARLRYWDGQRWTEHTSV